MQAARAGHLCGFASFQLGPAFAAVGLPHPSCVNWGNPIPASRYS